MKVDEFLKHQDEAGFELLATLEAISDKPGYVTLTPYSGKAGCRCASSIAVAATDIENIEPTGNVVWCCGKQKRLAKVTVRRATTIPLGDSISSMMMRQGGSSEGGSGDDLCVDCYLACAECLRTSSDKAACIRRLNKCLSASGCDE